MAKKNYEKIIKTFGKKKKFNSKDKENFFEKILKFFGMEDVKTLWHIVNHIKCAKKVFSIFEIGIIIAAVAYVIIPTDAIPDFLPIGMLDDYGVILYVLNKYGSLIDKYKQKCID